LAFYGILLDIYTTMEALQRASSLNDFKNTGERELMTDGVLMLRPDRLRL